MEKIKMMLNSILHEKNLIDRTILLRYYVNEYKSSNPIFLFQFFKLIFNYINSKNDFEFLELMIDNFYDEICMYGHWATKEFNDILSFFIATNKISYIIKLSHLVPELGDKSTLRLVKKLLQSLENNKYVDPKNLYIIKKSYHELDTKIRSANKKAGIYPLDQGIIIKWKRFEVVE
ncbi:MAG: hypothetical protein N2712_06610 [Brevinematales bacterium]|nr:hypothetical protein [Brevinematales bacterium]